MGIIGVPCEMLEPKRQLACQPTEGMESEQQRTPGTLPSWFVPVALPNYSEATQVAMLADFLAEIFRGPASYQNIYFPLREKKVNRRMPDTLEGILAAIDRAIECATKSKSAEVINEMKIGLKLTAVADILEALMHKEKGWLGGPISTKIEMLAPSANGNEV